MARKRTWRNTKDALTVILGAYDARHVGAVAKAVGIGVVGRIAGDKAFAAHDVAV